MRKITLLALAMTCFVGFGQNYKQLKGNYTPVAPKTQSVTQNVSISERTANAADQPSVLGQNKAQTKAQIIAMAQAQTDANRAASATAEMAKFNLRVANGTISSMNLLENKVTAQRGGFPAPYCGPLVFSSPEPITRVNVAGIDNVSPAATGGDAHQDFTAVEGNVDPGTSYPIALEGNTDGPFTNRFVVFVDWNQNDLFTDAGETYEITNLLVGSTGVDGMQATGTIAVPADALPGATRMRVKKIFGTTNYLMPCMGGTFGQAEDYTLMVSGGTSGGGDCDLSATLEDPATSATTWTRPFASGTCCSGVGVGVSYNIYGPFTVDTAGSYTFDLTTDGYDSFLFLYSTSFDPLDQETNFVAGNDDGPGGLTNSQIVTTVATATDYFLVSTSFSPTDFGDYVITITGPGAVTCGGGTGGADNDLCADATAVTCGGTFAGDTSDNTDAGGFNTSPDEWFKYTGAGVAQTVTLSLCTGTAYDSVITVYDSCGGTQVANNDDFCGLQSQVSFSSDGTSTYYIAVEGFGANGGVFSLDVTCVDIVPPSGCGVANTGTFENGKSMTQNLGRIVAHDVLVQDGENFMLESINLNAFIGATGSGVNASFVDIYVWADLGGAPDPANLIGSFPGFVPTSQTVVGSAFGFDAWDVELDHPDVMLAGVDGATTTYWVGISLEATDASNTFWENSTLGTIGFGEAYNDGLGGGFIVDGALEGVYDIAGTCTPIVVGPGGPCDQSNDGNAFENGRSFTQNLGRIVAHDISVDENGFTLETITLSAFIGATGSGVNAAFVDVYIYEDNAGAPGTPVGTPELGVIPTSQMVIGSNFGFDVWEVVLDITNVDLTGVVGGTKYWIGASLEATDASNVFWETTTVSPVGEGVAYDDGLGGGFVVDPLEDGVYTFAGTCGGGTVSGPCDTSNTGTFENGKSFTQNLGRIVAHDVEVNAGGFTLETINLNAFIGAAGSGVNAAFVDVYVYSDTAGAPGTLITSELGVVPTSQTVVGSAFGFDAWDVEIDVTDVPLTAAGTYWIGVSLEATDASNVFWENTTTSPVGLGEAYDDGLGGGFIVDNTLEGVYSFAGTCGSLGVSDNLLADFTYAPNPATDFLTLRSVNVIESATMYNLLGQKVMDVNINNTTTDLDVSGLATGTYLMRVSIDGQIGTYKVIKR